MIQNLSVADSPGLPAVALKALGGAPIFLGSLVAVMIVETIWVPNPLRCHDIYSHVQHISTYDMLSILSYESSIQNPFFSQNFELPNVTF